MTRYVVMTELKVIGQFQYKEFFKILPTPADAPMSESQYGWAYPCIIEVADDKEFEEVESVGMKVPEEFLKQNYSGKLLSEIVGVLSLFSKYRFFGYDSKPSWFITRNKSHGEPPFQSYCGYSGYYYDLRCNYDVGNPPPIQMIPWKEYYKNSYLNTIDVSQTSISFPDFLPVLLDKYYALNSDEKFTYLTSVRLFNQGHKLLLDGYASIGFAVLVSSIENMVAFIHKDEKPSRCKVCGNINYSVTRKFKDFMRKYAGNSPEFKKYSEKIYQKRSDILHKGSLFLGEVEPLSLTDEDRWQSLDNSNDIMILLRIVRLCLINWLLFHDNEDFLRHQK